MTHSELIKVATVQLKRWRCLPICTEMVSQNVSGEIPDVIGWTARASILIECKASRADFLADCKKIFRFDLPESGMGDFRFYFTNPGVITKETDIPLGWGVYEVIDGKVKYKFGKRYSNAAPIPLRGNKMAEVTLLRSYIRRTGNVCCICSSGY